MVDRYPRVRVVVGPLLPVDVSVAVLTGKSPVAELIATFAVALSQLTVSLSDVKRRPFPRQVISVDAPRRP